MLRSILSSILALSILAILLTCVPSLEAQCGGVFQRQASGCNGGGVAFTGGGRGVLIQQTQPAGLLGLRTKTRSTLVVPLGAPVCPTPQPPPDDDDDEEEALQTELLRQIAQQLADQRQENEVDENRDLLLLLLETLRERQVVPQVRRTGWQQKSKSIKPTGVRLSPGESLTIRQR